MLSEMFTFACLITARMEVWVLPAVLLPFNGSLELLVDIFRFFAAFSKLRNMWHAFVRTSLEWRCVAVKCGGAWMVRPKFQPLKAKRFHGLVSDAQMKGRSSISCCESPKSETDPSVTSYHPHLEAARLGEVRTADVCQDTGRSPERLLNSKTIPLKEHFLHLLHTTFGRRSILLRGTNWFTPFFALTALLAVKVRIITELVN